jgi:hypothetical protein
MRYVIPLAVVLCLGCETQYTPPHYEPAPPTLVSVEIISDPPGANIEVNDDYIGRTPCVVQIPSRGTARLFVKNTTIRAMPTTPGHYSQTKWFNGLSYGDRDTIPRRIFFDMSLGPAYRPPIEVEVVR